MFWAEVDGDKVLRVTVSETAEFGADWLMANVGGLWLECEDGVSAGFTYDEELGFIPPKIFPSWVLNEETLTWEAPVPKPEGDYTWDEEAGQWVPIEV
jgi:hypothetical protein